MCMRRSHRAAAAFATIVFLLPSASVGQRISGAGNDLGILQLEFEREKWQAETEMRSRELALKEREQANKDAELALKRQEQESSKWYNPLVVAIFAAAVAALGNAIVTMVNGRSQRQLESSKRDAERALEESKAESARILEMIKTSDTETAAKNLAFLLDTGLVIGPDRATKLRDFLDHRQPGTGPLLPAPTGFSFEATEALTPSIQNQLQKQLEEYNAYLENIGFPASEKIAQIKVMDKLGVPAMYDLNKNALFIDPKAVGDAFVGLQTYGYHVFGVRDSLGEHALAIEYGLAAYFAGSFLGKSKLGNIIAKALNLDRPYLCNLGNKR